MCSNVLLKPPQVDPMAALNDTACAFPDTASLPDLIAAQALLRPDACAVDDGLQRLTYGELEARACALAAHLSGLGAAPGARVGVCLERSVDTVAALLGVMKTGAAYVPLDPRYPADRLALMAEDAGCALVVVEPATKMRAPHGLTHVALNTLEPASYASRAEAYGSAYVIYTSGSTGRPKGVDIQHLSVVNLLYALQRRLDFGAGDVWLAVTTISFDISVLEIFLPLVFGGCVALADGTDGGKLARRIAAVRPAVLQATPATWRLLLAAGWRGDSAARLLCGGEAVDPPLARQLVEQGGGRFWNVYGPTETTVWSTASEVRAVADRVPIGLPLDNTRLHILDIHGDPVELGEPGELYIGGAGVARGYVGQPDLTAARFVPEPGRPGCRMYRTGDCVRLRRDGEVEFLGRVDQQVKVRGFRVEPGEVEARLCEHPQVAQAVVVAQPTGEGDSRLVAFVVARHSKIDPKQLQAFAALTLPSHLTPDLILQLDAFPLTPNGKIDRQALSVLQLDFASRAATLPRDDLERALLRAFEAVLGVRNIGVDDDFFALGGTSLGAVRLVSQIERRIGRRLHVNTLYHGGGSVAAIANVVRGDAAEVLPHLLPLGGQADDGRLDPIFCLHTLVEGTLFFYEALARRLAGRERLLGVLPRGLHDGAEADGDLAAMAAHCAATLRARQPEGPYRILGFSSAGLLAMETARHLQAQGQAVAFLGLVDAYPPVGRRTWRYRAAVQVDRMERVGMSLGDRLYGVGRRTRPRADLPLRQRHRAAVHSYAPAAYAGSAALFVSRKTTAMFAEPGLGWRRLICGDLGVDVLDGAHFSLVNEPHVQALAERVQVRLDQAG